MSCEASVRIANPTGLHARPAVKLAQLAARFRADIQLRVNDDGEWVKARSTARLMKLKARANATLHFRAEGEQAADALAALVSFVERNFEDSPAPPAGTRTEVRPMPAPENGGAEHTGAADVFTAEVAAEGVAAGVIYRPRRHEARAPKHGTPAEERRRLESAIAAATTRLRELERGSSEQMAAQIIAFQAELLADPEFIAPALEALGAGQPAAAAWERMLAAEIADYESAEDEYFRGRAGDLRDLRDQVLDRLRGAAVPEAIPEGAILLVEELPPSRFLELDWRRLAGAVMRGGSQNSHVAMLARARGVPLLIKLHGDPEGVPDGAEAILDAERGRLLLRPDAATARRYRERMIERDAQARAALPYLARAARTGDGLAVKVYINVDDPALLSEVDPRHCDGIGLTRTEFLFHGRVGLPDEETQYRAYRKLVEWARGGPVTIRTLDAGGDKPIPGLTPDGESNPFLGVRGIRLSLARPDVFRVQLRALARAAAHGKLRVMIPMVTLPAEADQARRLLDEEIEALRRSGTAAAAPPFGIMVEVPAAALAIGAFQADFYSIGSNDLIQYLMAAGRDSAATAALQDPLHPAVLELMARVAEHAARTGTEASVCGEMAARTECLDALLRAGVRALSVPPAALAPVKAALARYRASEAEP